MLTTEQAFVQEIDAAFRSEFDTPVSTYFEPRALLGFMMEGWSARDTALYLLRSPRWQTGLTARETRR